MSHGGAHSTLGVILLGLALASVAARAQVVPEAELRAAFVYNFLLLVEWPESASPQGEQPFLLCAFGDSEWYPALRALQGRNLKERILRVEKIESAPALSNCQAVVIASARDLYPVLQVLKGRPVLTIGDYEGSVSAGVMIGLTREDAHLAFEVNLDAARAGGLRVSAKLLRLARHVVGR